MKPEDIVKATIGYAEVMQHIHEAADQADKDGIPLNVSLHARCADNEVQIWRVEPHQVPPGAVTRQRAANASGARYYVVQVGDEVIEGPLVRPAGARS